MYQTIIIGGGPSGLMAAAAASQHSDKVLLIEKKKGLGRKLKISGGGRCNVTNRLPYEEIIKNIPGNGKFLYSPFPYLTMNLLFTFSNHVELHSKKKIMDVCFLFLIKHRML